MGNFVMTQQLPLMITDPVDIIGNSTEAELPAENTEDRTYETDPFTITASGSVIKGVESEQTAASGDQEKQTEDDFVQDTDELTDNTEDNGGEGAVDGTDDNSGDDDQAGADDGASGEDLNASDENSDAVLGSESSSDSESNTNITVNGANSGTSGSGSTAGGNLTGGTAGSTSSDGNSYNSSTGSSNNSGSSTTGGSGSSGSSSSGGGQSIIIQNPGNGDYYYDDTVSGSGTSSSGSSNSGGTGSSGGSSGSGSSSGSSSGGSSSSAWTPDDVILWGISSRYIDVSELYPYGASTLRLIRNEIFALHGRIFNSQDLMDYYSQKSWYVPTYDPETFDANMFDFLNDYEEANLQLILDYEAWLAEN